MLPNSRSGLLALWFCLAMLLPQCAALFPYDAHQREDQRDEGDVDMDRYRAWIVVNSQNKKDLGGFYHMDQVRYRTSWTDRRGNPDWNTSPRAMANLAEYLELYTDIKVDVRGRFPLDSGDLIGLKIPLIFLTGHYQIEFSEADARNLGAYLRAGGFLLVDDANFLRGGPFDVSARALIEAALGDDASFQRLSGGHWLYHCFFDFDGPPAGDDLVVSRSGHGDPRARRVYDHLESVFLDDRMVVLYSNKGLNKAWNGDWRFDRPGSPINDTRQMQFGVNILVFALTQTGGFAHLVEAGEETAQP